MSKEAPRDNGKVSRYRQRMREAGWRETLFQLPDETLAFIDDIKERQGLRNRSQALFVARRSCNLLNVGRRLSRKPPRHAKARLAGRALRKFVTGLIGNRSGLSNPEHSY
ncbi:hypothetical protein [Acidiphilium sp. 20-67-58]|uniref:hypothetical protein n=1 Tax=Acidiphilium sp. 20-67-58 TaxID=1970291 RepID=UPI0025BC7AE0|nr:hypothetical protein [Acidiphilium sp. 20-67-58]